jgi:predicted ArsR family transcriptional regulator
MEGQSSDGEKPEQPEFGTIAEALGKPRRKLLFAFLESDSEVLNTGQLRERTGVERGSAIHHLERLMKWGLIEEEPERQRHGLRGSKARAWRLTARGETFCTDHLGTPSSAFISPEDVDGLREQVVALEEDIDLLGGLLVKLAVDTEMVSEERGDEILEEVGTESEGRNETGGQ